MNYSRTFRDGSGRDEALKRRNGAVGAALGMAPKSDTDLPAEQSADGKPDDSKAPSSTE